MTSLQVVKRDGRVVPFDRSRIERAIRRAHVETWPSEKQWLVDTNVHDIANQVDAALISGAWPHSVEEIQDVVEIELMQAGLLDVAKAYILYRAKHAELREERPVPAEVRASFDEASTYFKTPLQQFQFFDKYSRYNPALGRRETWVETVDRTVDFLYELAGDRLDPSVYQRIRSGILEMRVTPSMRLLAMAGPAARRNNISLYNCSYQAVDSLDAFPEALAISMAGCGVGFSVEHQFVDQLPIVAPQRGYEPDPWVVEDSAEGWADALREGLHRWMFGHGTSFDYSQIRPAGSVLVTKGGRASGPEPLKKLLDFCRARILSRQGQRLRPIDVHDMMCVVGSAAVSGGVRRTAMISLFDEDDAEMLRSKAPGFDREHSYRWNANNSMVWRDVATTDQPTFIRRFVAMVDSGNGEPGIFSRENARATMPDRRNKDYLFGTNPCAEILLRSRQFCNLSAAIVRPGDTYDSLAEKVSLATIIGTIQSLATHFPGLRPQWKANCEEERLLGVDITGQMDARWALSAPVFEDLRTLANAANSITAQRLRINRSAAITCVKPSGNTSTLVDCASGLHARWSKYELRRVRVSATSPVYKVLRDAGVPLSPENGQDASDATTWVAAFPVAAPAGAITRNDLSALDQCNWWLKNKVHWTEHNPSVTITYRPDEVLGLMSWVWEHREKIGGMAFFPAFDGQLEQLPREEITREEYDRLVTAFPSAIDFSKMVRYETSDQSKASTTGACEGPVCLIGE